MMCSKRSKQYFRKFLGKLMVLLLSSGLLSVATVSVAQTSLLLDDYPESYTVRVGDSLWDIASQFLVDPERWQDVWQEDRFLDNAGEIFPGDIVSIALVGGSPRAFLMRGGREEIKLSPEVREVELASAIPAIPLESIENSFTRNRIIDPTEYEEAPYIIGNIGNNLAIGTGDEVYARGIWPIGTSSFEIYRQGQVFIEPTSEEILGMELEYLGFGSVLSEEEDGVRRLAISNSRKEIRVGDRLLIRRESQIDATIFPQEPEREIVGNIVGFLGNEALASLLDTVIINVGEQDSLEVGNILSISKLGNDLVDEVAEGKKSFRERFRTIFNQETVQLPAQELGTILIYRTFEKLSYGLILSVSEPVEINYQVVNPL